MLYAAERSVVVKAFLRHSDAGGLLLVLQDYCLHGMPYFMYI